LKIRNGSLPRPTRHWEEHRAGGVEPDRERDGRHQRGEDHEQRRRAGEVEDALQALRGSAELRVADAQQRHAVEVVEVDGRADDLEHVG